jgi:hypothetical protein
MIEDVPDEVWTDAPGKGPRRSGERGGRQAKRAEQKQAFQEDILVTLEKENAAGAPPV